MLEINFWVWSSAGSVGLKFSGPSAKLLITLIIFNFFRSDPLSSTYFDSRFNSPKENRYRPFETKLQKPPSCIPQWISIVSSRTQTFNLKENAQHSFTCSFLKRLPLAILRLFQCFYHFLVLYKKKSCISQRVIPLLVQRTGGKENFSLSDFFTCFGRVDDR